MKPSPKTVLLVALAVVAATSLHSVILYHRLVPLDGDECAEALMAMDFLSNPRFIVGWYGQNYMGSHEIYWLAALGPLFDWSPGWVRTTILLLVAAQLALVGYIAYRHAGPLGAVCALAVTCMLTPFAYSWETRARSYQVMPLLVLLALALETRLLNRPSDRPAPGLRAWLLIGVVTGSAVWANELALVLLFPVFALALTRRRDLYERLPGLVAGAIIGFLPRLLYNINEGFAGAKFLAAKVTQVTRFELETYGMKRAFLAHSFDVVGLSDIRTSTVTGLGYPMMAVTAVSAMLLLVPAVRKGVLVGRTGRLCAGLGASIVMCGAVSWLPPYATVMVTYLALFAGIVVARGLVGVGRLRAAALIILLLGCVASTVTVMRMPPEKPYAPEAELAETLRRKQLSCGISGYSMAHKIMFYSRRAVEVSVMGEPNFHARFNDVERRIAAEGAQFVAYDTADSLSRARRLPGYLEREGIDYRWEILEEHFGVYHTFSEPVHPGSYLGEEDRYLFLHYSPENPRRVGQEKANVLF